MLTIFSLVVNLDGKAKVTTFTDNGNIESANVLHNSVVRWVEKDSHDAIFLLFFNHFFSFSILGRCFFKLTLESFLGSLGGIGLSGKFARSLEPNVNKIP